MDFIPPCLGLCTVPASSSVLEFLFLAVLLSCVWLSSAARSCGTRDDSKKDSVCTPTIPSRRPPAPIIDHLAYTPSAEPTKHATGAIKWLVVFTKRSKEKTHEIITEARRLRGSKLVRGRGDTTKTASTLISPPAAP